MTLRSLWRFYRDELNDDANENHVDNQRISSNKIITSKSLEYNTRITGSTLNNNETLDKKVVVSLRYLTYFWRFLDFPLLNCEIELN